MRRRFSIRRRRVPFVQQMELAECGAACLSMVLGYHGHHAPLFEVRRECSVSRDGASAYSIAKAAQARGLATTAVRVVEPGGLAAAATPAIVHLSSGHFVVLERAGRSHAHVIDPARGRRKMRFAELFHAGAGLLLQLSPTQELVPTRPPRASRRAYLETTWSYAPTALLVLLGSLALELTGAVLPAAGQVLIDFSIRPRREEWLFVICAAMVAATALRLALLAVRDRSIHALTQLLDLGFMARFVDRLLALPIEFFHHRTTGDLIDRASANLELRGFTTRFFTGAIDATVVAGYTALLLAYDVPTGAVVILLSGARVLVLAALQRAAREAAGLEQARRGRETSALVQAFALPGLDRRARVREHLIERYSERLHARLQAAIARRRITEGTAQLTILLNGLMLALVLWVGGQRLLADEISMGVLAAFLAIGALVQRPLEGVLAALVQLGRMRSVLARTDDIFETPREPSGERDPSELPATITLAAVCFRYGHQNPDVIDQVSLHVGEGETVAIMGRSGAGKSTLARLMIGLLQPTAGAVRVGGADLAALDLDALRRLVGVVSQETFLFDDTIRNNLALKDPDLSLAEIREAARIACIDHVIADLPQGYDTVLGRQAHRLSGGERQRLAIARALVRSPRILLLDEATSALDPATEAEVYANLAALGRTQVVVAHRLAAARRADRIFVIDGGRIAQEGHYGDLAAAPGLFRRMVESAGGPP